jgi:hypothetical protein
MTPAAVRPGSMMAKPMLAKPMTARRPTPASSGIGPLIGAIAVCLLVGAGAPVYARASDCAAIRNSDRRAACEGRTRSRSDCEAIREADRRAACRAESRR